MAHAVADIPAVEAEIAHVSRLIRPHWQATVRSALDEIEEELERLERDPPRGRAAEIAAVVALILLFRRRLQAPLSHRRRRTIRESARRLLVSGVTSSPAGGLLRLRGPTIIGRSRFAARELEFLSSSRLSVAEDRLRMRILERIRNPEARRTPAERRAAPDAPRPLRPDGKPGAIDAAEWRAAVERTVADESGAVSDAVADVWAYRQWNVGVYHAARASRLSVLVAVNPDDANTTPFCHWVNGRIILLDNVAKQLADFEAAVRDGDKDAAMEAWPFIEQTDAALRKRQIEIGRRSRGGKLASQEAVFRGYFRGGGLPPYHYG